MMKKLVILILLAFTIFEPKPIEPVVVKPVLVETAKQWDLTKAYYQKVKMPDGSIPELKSRTPLDIKGWEALASKQWGAMQAAELAQPENCMDCHAQCGRKP